MNLSNQNPYNNPNTSNQQGFSGIIILFEINLFINFLHVLFGKKTKVKNYILSITHLD